MSHRVWFYLKQPVLLVAFLRKFTCLCEGCMGLCNLMIFEIDLFNFMVQIKYYLLWCEKCTLLNSRNKILTVKYILSFYMKVYQINRDDLVPTFYINATFNGGSCLSFLQSIIFQFYLYHVQSLDHL